MNDKLQQSMIDLADFLECPTAALSLKAARGTASMDEINSMCHEELSFAILLVKLKRLLERSEINK